MSRKSAERLLEAIDNPGPDHWPLSSDVEAVARAYLAALDEVHYANGVADLAMKHRDMAEAALTPTEDDRAVARRIVPCPHDRNQPGVEAPHCPECILQRAIAQALAAKGARQREADAARLSDRAKRFRTIGDRIFNGNIMADELDAHAVAIRSQP